MIPYIVSIFVKSGHEGDVARFYQELEPELKEAPGYHGRKIYQAKTGTMAEAVHRIYTPEELAAHAEPPHEDPGVQFIIIEFWDSVDERMNFSRNVQGSRQKALIPHLMPQHSHEFFEDISVD